MTPLPEPAADLLHAAQWMALRGWLGAAARDGSTWRRAAAGDREAIDALVRRMLKSAAPLAELKAVPAHVGTMTAAEFFAASRPSSGASDAGAGWDLTALDTSFWLAQSRIADLRAVERVVRVPGGSMHLSAFLETRVVELVAAALALRRCAPRHTPPPILPSARRLAVRILRSTLADNAHPPEELRELVPLVRHTGRR